MPDKERKTEFWWASIHGADPEPVEKTEREGRHCIYTLGCADPFYLDEPGVLMFDPRDNGDPESPMERPRHPDKIKAERAAIEAADQSLQRTAHSWTRWLRARPTLSPGGCSLASSMV